MPVQGYFWTLNSGYCLETCYKNLNCYEREAVAQNLSLFEDQDLIELVKDPEHQRHSFNNILRACQRGSCNVGEYEIRRYTNERHCGI
jgi:hypothetical protein